MRSDRLKIDFVVGFSRSFGLGFISGLIADYSSPGGAKGCGIDVDRVPQPEPFVMLELSSTRLGLQEWAPGRSGCIHTLLVWDVAGCRSGCNVQSADPCVGCGGFARHIGLRFIMPFDVMRYVDK